MNNLKLNTKNSTLSMDGIKTMYEWCFGGQINE